VLRRRLHALGDHGQSHRRAHCDDGPNDRLILGARPKPGDEGPVDLHARHGMTAQVAQRGVAGAEVVDHDAETERAQVHQHLIDQRPWLDHHGLRDLENERAGRDAMVLHAVPHDRCQRGVAQLPG